MKIYLIRIKNEMLGYAYKTRLEAEQAVLYFLTEQGNIFLYDDFKIIEFQEVK